MEAFTFYVVHGAAIVALALGSYGVGYQVAKGSIKNILTNKEN